jgi:hypothetical protein
MMTSAMVNGTYVVTQLRPHEEGLEPFVAEAGGPLEAALAAAVHSIGATGAPYAVDVERQGSRRTLISIHWQFAREHLRQRFEVVRVDDPLV